MTKEYATKLISEMIEALIECDLDTLNDLIKADLVEKVDDNNGK